MNMRIWRHWLREGWKYRGCHRLPRSEQREYKDRLGYETDIIEEKDFVSYHLIVADAVRWAKDNGITVGPGRGSAAASICCWLLRITELNPMEFPNLVFDRYIDRNRVDLPDIDLDFDSERRHEIRAYLVGKYGEGCVNNVGTFSTYKAKLALDDVARVFKIPRYEVATVKDLLVDRSSGDLRASATIEDTVIQFDAAREAVERYPDMITAMDLEGNVKGFGVHAAGLVISNSPIEDICATITREVPKGSGNWITVVGLDKYDAERQGLLKLDLLGLNTMSVITECLRMTNMTLEDLYQLPLDDSQVLQVFQNNDVVGVFQFEGRALKSVNGSLRADTFAEVCDATALARPGPLHNGAANAYIDIKRGLKRPDKPHPALERITGATNYQIVYQEQILRIVREIGGFDWTASAYIRKIISRKIGEAEFNKQKGKFLAGAAKLHEREPDMPPMPREEAEAIWGDCITSGSYAFCMTGDTLLQTDRNSYRLDMLYKWLHPPLLPPLPTGRSPEHYHGTCTVCGQSATKPRRSDAKYMYRRGMCGACINRMDKLRKNGMNILSMDDDGAIRPRRLLDIKAPVERPIMEVATASGLKMRMSYEHRILTTAGYKLAVDLEVGMHLLSMGDRDQSRKHPRGRIDLLKKGQAEVRQRSGGRCEHCSESGDGSPHALEFAHILSLDDLGGLWERYHAAANLLHLCNSCHKTFDCRRGDRKKRFEHGKPTFEDEIIHIADAGMDLVYDVAMDDSNHNYIGDGAVQHNNFAHSVSYSLISYWLAYYKSKHPAVFYAASLNKGSAGASSTAGGIKIDRKKTLLQDAVKHGITVLPPSLQLSQLDWTVVNDHTLLAGFQQIEGFAEKRAQALMDSREQLGCWDDLIELRGVGAKTVARIKDFVTRSDPFGIYWLGKTLAKLRSQLDELGVPQPTHTGAEVPYESGPDTEVTWMGVVVHRNLRDIFETNRSRTGEELSRDSVKDPELNEFCLMYGADDSGEYLNIRFNRYQYPRFREMIWGMDLGRDVVVVHGVKPGWRTAREVYVHKMWVIDPDD